MTAYYNEHDEFAADWLRNLIKAGLIADGEVDTRSIVDVRPGELSGFTQCHFFAGIGGWSYALRSAGWPDDIAVWTGSCPCQPFSLAGKQKGFSDDRHLWPIWFDLIEKQRPAIIFGEQVASAGEWLRLVRGDLEALDYAVGAMPIQAASAGADHLRDRYWFVAYADDERSQGRRILFERAGQRTAGADGVADAGGPGARRHARAVHGAEAQSSGERKFDGDRHHRPVDNGSASHLADGKEQRRSAGNAGSLPGTTISERTPQQSERRGGDAEPSFDWVIGADGKARRVKSGIRLLAHGVPARVGKLRGFGNAIDPRPAAAFITAAVEALSLSSHQENTP